MQALYDTGNRAQRIMFPKQKREDGLSIIEIANLLLASHTIIRKYLELTISEIPQDMPTAREKQYRNSVAIKQKEIDEIKKCYLEGCSIYEISRKTGHIAATIHKYLNPSCTAENGHYNNRRVEKLTPYKKEVITMRLEGVTYRKIQEYIGKKGYAGVCCSAKSIYGKRT